MRDEGLKELLPTLECVVELQHLIFGSIACLPNRLLDFLRAPEWTTLRHAEEQGDHGDQQAQVYQEDQGSFAARPSPHRLKRAVLIERRKHLHERIAAAVEQLYANSIDDHLDELAHHYNRSGDVTKAVGYYERAGLRAVQRSAYAEAMRDLTTALELLQRMPQNTERDQRELALQTSLGPVLMAAKGWAAPETDRVYLRAQELAESGGTPVQRFSLLTGLFGISFIAGRLAAAGDRQTQIRDFTRQHPEPAFVLEACHHDWSFALSVGELETAQRHVDDGLALYDAQLHYGAATFAPSIPGGN